MLDIHELIRHAAEVKASDIFIKAGAPPNYRLHGRIGPVEGTSVLTPDETRRMAYSIMTHEQIGRFEHYHELDLALEIPEVTRVRANIHQQRGSIGLVCRLVPLKIYTLDQLGMPPAVGEMTKNRSGLVLVTGPTGSGKSTTLAAMINKINTEQAKNIITIEDPIEYRLEGISQTAVNVAAELTFAKILRSTLRQDPDVILVGEIRDRETAEIAMQAAMTGHFVFTTLHANDAPTTVTRLLDIGVEATLIQSAVSAVLAQRLVRVLCTKCREPVKLSDDLKEKWGIPAGKEVTVYREKGCPACHGTGFRGRTGLHELMVFDNDIRELLVGRPSIQTIRQAARKNGMKTLLESGIGKVLAGVTSVSEMQRVAK